MSIGIKLRLKSLYSLVETDIKAVDAFIDTTLRSGANKASLPLLEHVLESAGKRVRPLLVLFTYYAVKQDDNYDNLIKVASALELIHTASLVHDDVIDNASVRRDQATVNAKYGNESAVAMGVYLYSVSLQLISEAGSLEVLTYLSKAVKAMCEGELYQLSDRDNVDLSVDHYLKIIQCKTADLFTAACSSGALVAGASSDVVAAMGQYGYNLGMLFQLTDDYLDYFGSEGDLNKELGQDLDQGQITLPLLMLLDLVDERDELLRIIQTKDTSRLGWVKQEMDEVGLPTHYATFMKRYYDDGCRQISDLDGSQYRDALRDLLEVVFTRSGLSV